MARAQHVPSDSFDFYISPTGSDSNAGTAAHPWAITAINTRHGDYAGKRVGLLNGTYNVHSLCQVAPVSGTALAVNGGPSASSPTIIAAVNAREAVLTAADPATGAYPTVARAIIGQGYEQVANKGNVILDALYITRSFGSGIEFFPAQFPNPEGGVTGIVVRNCEIYDIGGIENNNVGGIRTHYCTGALISNNMIHSVEPLPPGGNDAGIYSFNSRSNVYEYNTIYDCNVGIHDKNPHTGNHTYRYNRITVAGAHPVAALFDCSGGDAGDVVTAYNNLFIAPVIWDGSDLALPSKQSLVFYNNTCYSGGEGGIFYPAGGSQISPPAMVAFYNNIIYCERAVGWAGAVRFCSGTVALSNYNIYRAEASPRGMFGLSSVSAPRGAPTLYTLSAWQKATGQDGSSIESGISSGALFAPPASLQAVGYQLHSSAVGRNMGRVGGIASGAATDVGAWGGGATRIGCDFGPMPRAPILNISK